MMLMMMIIIMTTDWLICNQAVFTALQLCEMSVSLSVCQTREFYNKTKQTFADNFIPYEKWTIPVFDKKNGWWGTFPSWLLPDIFGQNDPPPSKTR